MKPLTARQREALDLVLKYRAEKGYAPSIRELRPMLGVSSLRGVTVHLDALERKGWIEREKTSRSIRILVPEPGGEPVRSIPLLGTIAAGVPLLAVENVEGYVPVPADMAGPAEELFALRVRGDSMTGEHILDGDLVVIQSQVSAEHGQVVAVLIGDEATVKRLDVRSRPPRLLPSNPAYQPIELARGDTRILGKVVGLIRLRAS